MEIEGEKPKTQTDTTQRSCTTIFRHSRLPTPGAESDARLSLCPRSVKIKLRLREKFPQRSHIRIRCRVEFNTYLRATYMCHSSNSCLARLQGPLQCAGLQSADDSAKFTRVLEFVP